MTSNAFTGLSRPAHYRRGAIMGLTVAEAFMLVAFVLLMLLLFWRYATDREREELQERVRPLDEPLVEAIAIAAPNLTLENRRRLGTLLVRGPAEANAAIEVAAGLTASELVTLGDGATPVPADELAGLERDADLVRGAGMRDLADAAAALSAEQRERLSELLSGGDAGTLVETASQLHTRFSGRTTDDIADALEIRDALDPYGEASNAELVEDIDRIIAGQGRIAGLLQEEAEATGALETALRTRLGARIEQAGGRIEPGGNIVFPETFLFDTGEFRIRSDFAGTLNAFCPEWLTTLRISASSREIDTIRIEGHSSTEWFAAPTRQTAWVRNLELSQRRAESVLVYCLNLVDGTPLGEWSRPRLAATGFSSSRPIVVDGGEDPRASRRVVFGIELSRRQLVAALGADPAGEPARIGPLTGAARAKDADTIEVAGHAVRLEGIDALEKTQTCLRPNGSPWPCGHEALSALAAYLEGQTAVCEDLKPDLRRFRARCRVAGNDLGRWIVRQGWALAWVKHSDAYIADETHARNARQGAWSGEPPTPPWEWRRQQRPAR